MESGLSFQIKENFLITSLFEDIKNQIMTAEFPWYFNEHDIPEDKSSNFMFTHTIYRDGIIKSNYFQLVKPICHFINDTIPIKNILRIKLNCYTNQGKEIKHKEHIDIEDKKDVLVGVFHINENNGNTCLSENGGDICIQSKENQMILLDNSVVHYGTTQTDTDLRIVINFNLLK